MHIRKCCTVIFCLLAFNMAANAASYTQTKYPIVLLTGVLGSPNAFGPIPTEYFYGIKASLESSGARVYVPQISPLNDDFTRGKQVQQYIEEYVIPLEQALGYTWVNQVNIIAHSQGGLTGRYVAGAHPDIVASLTTVGTPNNAPTEGFSFIDVATYDGLSVNGYTFADFIAPVTQLLGDVSAWLSQSSMPNDAEATLTISKDNFAAINQAFPQGVPAGSPCGQGEYINNGVRYYSWGGTGNITNFFDPSDSVLTLFGTVFSPDDANDGIIGRCQTHLGKVIRDDYFMNHGDLINGLYGLTYPFTTDPRTLYRKHANHLKNIGL